MTLSPPNVRQPGLRATPFPHVDIPVHAGLDRVDEGKRSAPGGGSSSEGRRRKPPRQCKRSTTQGLTNPQDSSYVPQLNQADEETDGARARVRNGSPERTKTFCGNGRAHGNSGGRSKQQTRMNDLRAHVMRHATSARRKEEDDCTVSPVQQIVPRIR